MGKAHTWPIRGQKMAAIFALLVLFAACVSEPGATSPSASLAKKDEAIRLKQVSFLYGEHTIYLTRDGIKDISEKTGVVSIARAPDWRVLSYNPLTKVYIENAKQSFTGALQKTVDLFGENNMHDKPLLPVLKKATQFMNHPSQLYATASRLSREVLRLYSLNKVRGAELARVDMTNVLDVPLPEEQKKILCKIFDLPDKPGLTVEFTKTYADGTVEPHLHTTLISTGKLPSSELLINANFRKVKDYSQLLSNSESTNDGLLKMMIGDGKKTR